MSSRDGTDIVQGLKGLQEAGTASSLSAPGLQVSMIIVHSSSLLSDEQVVNPISPDTSKFLPTVKKCFVCFPIILGPVLKGSIPPLTPGIQDYHPSCVQEEQQEVAG